MIEWPDSTNRGTALLKLLHQSEAHPLVRDEFVAWFLENTNVEAAGTPGFGTVPSREPADEFQRIAYWYVILREKFFDELVLRSVADGSRQLLLLGSGFDTRFLRLEALSREGVRTFEVDLPATIAAKRRVLREKLGRLPSALRLEPFDLRRDPLEGLFAHGLDRRLPTTCIWQGVSYYLPRENVSAVLAFVQDSFAGETVLGFDCCTPHMLRENARVPGVRFNIDRLAKIGEPYLFGMETDSMGRWLDRMGYGEIRILEQPRLAETYLRGLELPGGMWYVVSARCGSRSSQGRGW